MSDLFTITAEVYDALRKLEESLYEQLDQVDTDYRIEYKGKTWDFDNPITLEDKKEHDKKKKALTKIFIRDAISKILQDKVTTLRGLI